MNNNIETPNRISKEAVLTRVAMAAGISGAILATTVATAPVIVISSGIIVAAAAVLVLK